jgi:uncharacterized damage-inducible protein DinB
VTERGGIAPFYAGWELENEALIGAIARLTPAQLATTMGEPPWPVWASVAHIAGTRVYWLCHVFGEAGAETTPFNDPRGMGWEDDLAHSRSADELVGALRATWRIVEHTLATWTPDTLGREARRTTAAGVQLHTRQSVIMRMITHEAYHCGEIALTLGTHGLDARTSPNGPIDMWAGLGRLAAERP